MMFKVSDDLANLIGLGKEATPEAFEQRILDLCASVESHQKMNKELTDSLNALTARVVALENRPAPTVDMDEIAKCATAAAKLAASEMVSAAIAKSGVTATVSTTATAETESKPQPTLIEQYEDLPIGMQRAEFRAKHPEILNTLPVLPLPKK